MVHSTAEFSHSSLRRMLCLFSRLDKLSLRCVVAFWQHVIVVAAVIGTSGGGKEFPKLLSCRTLARLRMVAATVELLFVSSLAHRSRCFLATHEPTDSLPQPLRRKRGTSDADSPSQTLTTAAFHFGRSGTLVCKLFVCNVSLSPLIQLERIEQC